MADNENNNRNMMEMKRGDDDKPRREIKSNFSLTCSLLSQYMKEKKRFGELGGLDLAKGKLRSAPTTMSLLPGVCASEDKTEEKAEKGAPKSMDFFPQFPSTINTSAKDTDKVSVTKEMPKAQMTIFYGGKVMVFDDFPAEKAKDLMQIASKESFTASQNFRFKAPPSENASDMPIARRNSLHRFLEKRKDRISTKAPYQVHGGSSAAAAAAKPEDTVGWLGLGPKISEPENISGSSR